MPPPAEPDIWSIRVRDALSRYRESRLRSVAARLVKPRTTQPIEELLDKAVAMLGNPPVVDRRIKDLSVASRKLLALIGLSRQPRWKVGHLISLLAALGHAEGFGPVQEALEAGLLYPDADGQPNEIDDFQEWLGQGGTLQARVFAHPAVAARARGEDLELPKLEPAAAGASNAPVRVADGLEWPLRLAAVWQQVGAAPLRLTQANTLFTRDQTRLQSDEVLNAPTGESLASIAEPGILALFWASAAGLLEYADGELHAGPFPAAWEGELFPVLVHLFASLPLVEAWDPLGGYSPGDDGLSAFPSAALLALLLTRDWVEPAAVAAWLWEHHPTWAGLFVKDGEQDRGARWVAGFLLGVAFPLRLVEAAPAGDGWVVRLSDLGRHLLAGQADPKATPVFPQTLLVQPNAEILAYRQGLTPELIGMLSRFARWKGIGPACTLELNPEQTYRGLESGLTLPMIHQTLARHGTRPMPPSVVDLLQRWADKRERITIFTSAVLVEFPTAADLDAAVSRGIVSIRLTDRIGMSADGAEPGLSQLRIIGNRDYEAKPIRCVTVADDGVTLTVDAAQADLLLEAEIGRYADPLTSEIPSIRRFRLSPQSLRRAADLGLSLSEIDAWFIDRTGAPLSPAGRLFLLGSQLPPPSASRRLVVQFASREIADGVMQWPESKRLVAERLGPTAMVVEEDQLAAFRQALTDVGIALASSESFARRSSEGSDALAGASG